MTAIQNEVWEKMLSAQLCDLYWAKKARWLSIRLRCIQLVAAIIGCGALASFFAGPEYGPLKSFLGVVAAVLALVLSTFDLRGALYQVEETRRKFASNYVKLDQLWQEVQIGQLSEHEIVEHLKPISEELGKIEEPHVIDSKRLKEQAYNEIVAARGLTADAH